MFAALRTAAVLNRSNIERYAHSRTERSRAQTLPPWLSSNAPSAAEIDMDEALVHMDDPAIVADSLNSMLTKAMQKLDAVIAAANEAQPERVSPTSGARWETVKAAAPAPPIVTGAEAHKQAVELGSDSEEERSARVGGETVDTRLASSAEVVQPDPDVFAAETMPISGTTPAGFIEVVPRKLRKARETVRSPFPEFAPLPQSRFAFTAPQACFPMASSWFFNHTPPVGGHWLY